MTAPTLHTHWSMSYLSRWEQFPSGAAYYVDSQGGDDGNRGLSADSPWQTIARVNGTTLVPGAVVLFKCGASWNEMLVASDSGTAGSPITFGSYGSGAAPIISGFRTTPGTATPGNWTDYGATVANTWYITVDLWPYARLFVNGVEKYSPAAAASVNATFPWWYGDIGGTNRLLVYSVANPSGLAFTDNYVAASFLVDAAEYITASGIEFQGSRPAVWVRSKGAVPSRYVTLDDCTIGYRSGIGVLVERDSGTVDCGHVTLADCTIDGGGPPMPSRTDDPTCIGDGIWLRCGDYFDMHGCTLTRWYHSSLYALNQSSASTVRYASIHDNVFDGDGITYNRAVGFDSADEDGCSNNDFYANTITAGVTVRSQLNGDHNKFRNNDVHGPGATPLGRVTGTTGEGVDLHGYAGPCHHNEVTANTFTSLAGPAVRIRAGAPSADDKHDIVVSGNTIAGCGTGDPAEVLYDDIGLWVDDGADVYGNTITGNVISGAASPVWYRGSAMTVPALNAQNGHDGDIIRDNS